MNKTFNDFLNQKSKERLDKAINDTKNLLWQKLKIEMDTTEPRKLLLESTASLFGPDVAFNIIKEAKLNSGIDEYKFIETICDLKIKTLSEDIKGIDIDIIEFILEDLKDEKAELLSTMKTEFNEHINITHKKILNELIIDMKLTEVRKALLESSTKTLGIMGIINMLKELDITNNTDDNTFINLICNYKIKLMIKYITINNARVSALEILDLTNEKQELLGLI